MTVPVATLRKATAGRETEKLHPSVIIEVLQLTGRNMRKLTRERRSTHGPCSSPGISATSSAA